MHGQWQKTPNDADYWDYNFNNISEHRRTSLTCGRERFDHTCVCEIACGMKHAQYQGWYRSATCRRQCGSYRRQRVCGVPLTVSVLFLVPIFGNFVSSIPGVTGPCRISLYFVVCESFRECRENRTGIFCLWPLYYHYMTIMFLSGGHFAALNVSKEYILSEIVPCWKYCYLRASSIHFRHLGLLKSSVVCIKHNLSLTNMIYFL